MHFSSWRLVIILITGLVMVASYLLLSRTAFGLRIRASLENPALRKRLEELGLEIMPPEQRTPEYLAKFLPEDIARWAKPIHAAGISAD